MPEVTYTEWELKDLNGDGYPDVVFNSSRVDYPETTSWRVWFGTGTGFAPPIDIEGDFGISGELERCDGKFSNTTSGLYDIDGDGKPELVVVNGGELDVYQLAGGSWFGSPEAGRLVQVDNGYGALTTITYRSAKEDGTTQHQVPFAEIVVNSVQTTGTRGLGGTLSATRYAYGGAELIFDSALDAFTLPGYQRAVALRVVPAQGGEQVDGLATITDTYGLAPFATTPKSERFGRYLRVGRVRDVNILSGVSTNPWTLLATDLTTDPRRIAATHYDWAPKLFEEPAINGVNVFGCFEIMYPYDYVASFAYNIGSDAYNVCSAHGFLYGSAVESWRGTAAPPSADNVVTRSQVLEIDDYGRVVTAFLQNDLYRYDDDVCVKTSYPMPTGTNERGVVGSLKPADLELYGQGQSGRHMGGRVIRV